MKEGKYVNFQAEKEIVFNFNPAEGKRSTDYLVCDKNWFLVSERVKMVFDTLEERGVQYIPVRIYNKETEESSLGGYSVANVVNVLDALNLEHSDYSVFEYGDNQKLISVKKYALNKPCLENKHVFKLHGDEFPLFVSEEFKKEVEKNKLTGFDFLEVKVI
ncbi:hypothetical protein SAMN04487866_1442 [Thermoactinomyces sp. DSM 45891]|uniref:imm11 family protein n=1 Tax=Thermoactinomyces sp. DSM 45891 TaxID=1761907 RepID=UPI0009187510|nr:DUF1629 domain-containing protein [Thermoactinomyces sp. DSM 45891]SFX84777.1 hypothetical protein SAMN04487866_1442 [Thermoactinomyces sp. DSM 45891]